MPTTAVDHLSPAFPGRAAWGTAARLRAWQVAALDCYHSPAYQAAIQLRLPVSTGELVFVEGYDGPQPG